MIYAIRFVHVGQRESYGTIPIGEADFPFLCEVYDEKKTHVWSGDGEIEDWWKHRICSWMIVVDGV